MRIEKGWGIALALTLLVPGAAQAAHIVNVNPTSIDTHATGTVRIDVTGVLGTSVILRLYVDANGNGAIDAPDDYVVWTDVVADNVADWSPNMFSDTDVDVGEYTVDLRLFSPLEFPYTAGDYIWEVEDTQNSQTTTATFSVTQTAGAQSVSGTVRDSGTMLGIPGAFVVLLPFCDGADEADRFYSTFADENGAYAIQVPAEVQCRNRVVVGAKPGYLTPFTQLPNLFFDGSSTFTNQDPEISAGTWTVTGTLQYSSGPLSGSGIPGTFVTAESADGPPWIAIAFTDENGDYSFQLDDGSWNTQAPEDGIATRGAVFLEDSDSVLVSGAPNSFATLTLPAANAYFEGTVRDDGGVPVAGRWVGAFRNDSCDPFCYNSSTVSRADGSYTLNVIGPAGPSTYGYQLEIEDPITGLVGEQDFCQTISDGETLTGRDLDHLAPTSFITGTMTDADGQAVQGSCVFAQSGSVCTGYKSGAVTDCNGDYSIPVVDGNWNLEVNVDEFASFYSNLSPDSIFRNETVAGADVIGVDFVVGPWRRHPHITRLVPSQVIAGSHLFVIGYGFSFGSDPQVFFDATPATVIAFRADQGGVLVEIPPSSTAGNYQVTVVNTDSGAVSDPACIEIGAGPYSPVCTIDGTVTDAGGNVQGGLVLANRNGQLVRTDVTDAGGYYAIDLDAPGDYHIEIRPPFGTSYPNANYNVTCGTTQNHFFNPGFQLTGQIVDGGFGQIAEMPVVAIEIGGAGYFAITHTDENGNFTLNVPGGFIVGITAHAADTRYTPTLFHQNTVTSNLDFGQVQNLTGSFMTGRIVDDVGNGVAARMSLYHRINGSLNSVGFSDTCTGNYAFGLPPNFGIPPDEYVLDLEDDAAKGLQAARVEWIVPNGDFQADFDFTLFNEALYPTTTTAPKISFVDPGPQGQAGQPLRMVSANLGGTTVDVLFSDGGGGFVAGTDTEVDAARGLVATKVPSGAATGEMKIRVDGVDSEPVPFRRLSGTFNPGGLPYTLSGTVTGGGAGTTVAVLWADPAGSCDVDGFVLVDYGLTDVNGDYGPLSIPGGDIDILFLPPTGTTFAAHSETRAGVMSNQTVDVTLTTGTAVSVRAIDTSMNPLENIAFWTEGSGTNADQRLTDSNGDATLYVPLGTASFGLIPILGERLVETESEETIAGTMDFGDVSLGRGVIVSSAVQQSDGSSVGGALIDAQQNEDPFDFFHETLAGVDGRFHGPVKENSAVLLQGRVFDDALHGFQIQMQSDAFWDTVLHPSTKIGPAGFVTGLVRDGFSLTPLENITVLGFEEDPMNPGQLGNFIDQTSTCPDGTYELKLPIGPHYVQFNDFQSGTYAPELYDDASCVSGASTVTVPQGGSVTADADLDAAGSISGTVLAGGIQHAGAFVCADSVLLGGCTLGCATSDMNGDYSIPVPAATDYVVSAFSPTFGTSQCYDGNDDCLSPTAVVVTAGMNTPNIDFNLGCDMSDFDMDGVTECQGDCNDFDPNNYPGNTEVCDGQDNDCDGLVDDGDPGGMLMTWYLDSDMDSYGDPAVSQMICAQPAGYVADNTDCDDSDFNINPGVAEVCFDGIDNNCDGNTDDTGVGATVWYADSDSDTYGDPGANQLACDQPVGFVADNSDCDDTDASVNPGAPEVCGDGIDNNCDGNTDDDGIGAPTWYLDSDSDTYGDPGMSQTACGQPGGYVADNTDCDDTDASVNPAAVEVCFDAIDNDCDGNTDDDGVGAPTWYFDSDSDSYGDIGVTQSACNQPAGFVADNTDCDDSDAAVNPGATEVCGDAIDNDCDGNTDDDGIGAPLWYFDSDLDTYGDPAVSQSACNQPVGFVANNTDCDDSDAGINPDASEINDGVDNQCNGIADEIDGLVVFANPGDDNELSWPAQPGATMYRIARSGTRDFSDVATFLETAATQWSDPTLPAPGEVEHYLVRSLAPFEGSWGLNGSSVERGVNVLSNGNMEDWTTPTDLATWIEINGPGPVEQENDPAHVAAGNSAARITRTGAGVLGLLGLNLPLQPGRDYTLSFSAKYDIVEAGAVEVRIFNFTTGEDLQSNGTWAAGQHAFNYGLTTSYQTFSIPFTVDPGFAPTDDLRIVVRQRFTSAIGRVLWLDAFRIDE